MLGHAMTRVAAVTASNETTSTTISVHEAVARALKYNLDRNVETAQIALRAMETRSTVVSALPAIVANAGYAARNNDLSTASLDLPTGLNTPADGVSQERTIDTHDVSFSWNILDFALSYVRAQQAADKHLMAVEQRRKIVQRIIEDTRAAYARAVSAERLTYRLMKLDERTKRAIARTRAAAKSGAETPMTALTYERELTQIRQTAERMAHELGLAKSQLAALINIAPGVPFKLVDSLEQPDPPVFHLSAEEMIAEAIFNRPEIRDIAYQQRITQQEATAAFLELLPGLRLTLSASHSDDHYLLNHNWTTWGAAAAGNLIKLIQLPAKQETVEAQQELLKQKSLALTMAIMTQVYVSRIRHRHNHELLATAKEYHHVQKLLVGHLQAEKAADLIGEQTVIREEMNLLVAEAQVDIATGNVLGSSSNLMTTLGYDLQGRDIDAQQDLNVLTEAVRANWSQRVAVSDRARYLAELERAREEARKRLIEIEKQRQAEAARIRAEHARAAKVATDAAAETVRQQKAETARLRAETDKARRDVRTARANGSRRTTAPVRAEADIWNWIWPSEQTPSGASADRKSAQPKPYSGTK